MLVQQLYYCFILFSQSSKCSSRFRKQIRESSHFNNLSVIHDYNFIKHFEQMQLMNRSNNIFLIILFENTIFFEKNPCSYEHGSSLNDLRFLTICKYENKDINNKNKETCLSVTTQTTINHPTPINSTCFNKPCIMTHQQHSSSIPL